mgnify:CR=1 FL=1
MQIRHFLLTNDGAIEQIPAAQAAAVAAGRGTLPQFAASHARYLQVIVDDAAESNTIQVRTAGALVGFDASGRINLAETGQQEENSFSSFEHDTCVQLALDGLVESDIVTH